MGKKIGILFGITAVLVFGIVFAGITANRRRYMLRQ